MALELFKPFVIGILIAKGLAHNIKSAGRLIEQEMRAGHPERAVIDGVRAVSDLLALHWPQQEGQSDEDELPNRPALLD